MANTVRKTGAERRSEIAAAVLRIVGERGLTTLSTATIAKEVGLTSGALYRHFASIDEILNETARYGVERIDATFPAPDLPPLDRIVALMRNRVALLGKDVGLAWLLRSEQAQLTLPEEAVGRLRGAVRRSRRFVLVALREGAADGSIRADISPQALSVVVLGTTHAVIGAQASPRRPARGASPRSNEVLAAVRRLLEPTGRSR